MSTTTAADLVTQADLLVRELRNSTDTISLTAWETFDVTAYRVLHELVGPGRAAGDHTPVRAHAALVQVLLSYPTPLRPPVGSTTYSVRQAAQFLGLPRDSVMYRIHHGDIPATTDGHSYGIAASDLDQRTDLSPADPNDRHPLVRLSCTFGVLADLLVADRDRAASALHDDVPVAALMARVLTLTAVSAQHTMSHCRVSDADRPLRVAQFAERAVDALGMVDQPRGLDRIMSSASPPSPNTLNERLEAALRTWVLAGREDLNQTVPSTEVLRNIANQGRHIYAVTDRLLELSGHQLASQHDQTPQLSGALREAAEALRHADDQWAAVTTAMKPSHQYVATARNLCSVLKDIGQLDLKPMASRHSEHPLDIDQALSDLSIAGADLVDLLHDAQHLPEVLIRSELLFAPARTLKPSLDRLASRDKGAYVAVVDADVPNLAGQVREAGASCRVASEILQTVAADADLHGQRLSKQALGMSSSDGALGLT